MNRNVQFATPQAVFRSKPKARGPSYLAAFPPGYFALVMATGIVSLAIFYQGWETAARVLLGVNLAAYLVLWTLTLMRLICHRASLIHDLTHHFHSAAFLTIVAGTCVLGCQFALLTPWMPLAKVLWFVGAGLWVILSYTFFTVVTVRDPKPSLAAGISGVWLLAVVSTEAVSVLGTLIAPALARPEPVLFISLASCLVGVAIYIFFITLILYRWMFFRMRPERLTPDYWIDMGALAIATLAGTLLLSAADQWNLLRDLKPFLLGLTLLFWATATWWIPFLLIVEVWRHVRGRVPFVYSPDYWSLVFPLGMYSVATARLMMAADLAFLNSIAAIFTCAAVGAWGITFWGMIRDLARKFRPS